jgi:hypothetical protein
MATDFGDDLAGQLTNTYTMGQIYRAVRALLSKLTDRDYTENERVATDGRKGKVVGLELDAQDAQICSDLLEKAGIECQVSKEEGAQSATLILYDSDLNKATEVMLQAEQELKVRMRDQEREDREEKDLITKEADERFTDEERAELQQNIEQGANPLEARREIENRREAVEEVRPTMMEQQDGLDVDPIMEGHQRFVISDDHLDVDPIMDGDQKVAQVEPPSPKRSLEERGRQFQMAEQMQLGQAREAARTMKVRAEEYVK